MLYTSEDRHPLLLYMHSSNLLKIKTTSSVTKNIVRVVPFTRVRLKKLLLTFTFAFFTAAYIIYVTSPTSHFSFPQFLPFSFSNENLPYLINTSTCQVRDWPLFDSEILPLFENLENVENFGCDKDGPLFTIERVNFTWIFIGFPKIGSWSCNAIELARASSSDGLTLGPTIENLETYTNFDRSQMDEKVENGSQFRWDSVKVNCRSAIKQENNKTLEYSRVVPLVQQYQPKTVTAAKPKINIMLLGIDSVSRLNFLRHMHRTKAFLDDKGFIPLLGHHKVGENSFPNILPMLTGHLSTYYYNDSQNNDGFKFDNIRMIFKDAAERGYLTTFIEDMPPYGFFTVRGGFTDQPTHYYLRPTNLAIWDSLYYTYTCYQDRIEHEIYWDYLLDLYQAIRLRSNSAHFTLAHMSTLTHNFFNHAGYADRPFSSFLERLFKNGHNQNSVIMVYSDHALRFGSSVNTTANVHEQRLPLFYMYIPDSLELDGLNADQLRAIVVGNQHRLTSHLDMHATMMHLLTGNSSQKDSSFRGRSLLTPISLNRTCASAGILPQYCLCDAYEPISLTENMRRQSHEVVLHINRLMSAHGNFCVPLETGATYRAFDSTHSLTGNRYRLLHFSTRPNEAIFEAIVRIESHGGNAQKGGEKIVGIENISRLTRYGDESSCVADKLDILQFCLCWEQLKEKEKEKEG